MSSIFEIETGDNGSFQAAKSALIEGFISRFVPTLTNLVETELVEVDVYQPNGREFPVDMLEPFAKDLVAGMVSMADYQAKRSADAMQKLIDRHRNTSRQVGSPHGDNQAGSMTQYDEQLQSLIVYAKRRETITDMWQALGDAISSEYEARFGERPWCRQPVTKSGPARTMATEEANAYFASLEERYAPKKS